MNDFEYSDSMVKFVIERYLHAIGIHGNFMNFYKNGSPKYRKPKVTHNRRVVIEREQNIYEDSDLVKFKNMSLEEVINAQRT